MSHHYAHVFHNFQRRTLALDILRLIYRRLDCLAKEGMVSGSSGGVDGLGEAMMGEEAAEADERYSGAGSGGSAREFGGLGEGSW